MVCDILQLRVGRCKYCVTDDSPFLFCNEPVRADGSSYCAEHHAVCHAGFGRDVGLIESMIYGMDASVTRAKNERPNSVPVDEQIRGRS